MGERSLPRLFCEKKCCFGVEVIDTCSFQICNGDIHH